MKEKSFNKQSRKVVEQGAQTSSDLLLGSQSMDGLGVGRFLCVRKLPTCTFVFAIVLHFCCVNAEVPYYLHRNVRLVADGLIAELILSSCYDFINHVCEVVLKHLSVLQKLRECPEDSREAVASLMFAAARFSDLRELRDLRNLFQDRYGNSLELYVNQKLAENLSSKLPSEENKLQLLRDIALEFNA